ncbi:unnamed protein product, partial [Acanthoscelides obtectus]
MFTLTGSKCAEWELERAWLYRIAAAACLRVHSF